MGFYTQVEQVEVRSGGRKAEVGFRSVGSMDPSAKSSNEWILRRASKSKDNIFLFFKAC